MLVLGLRTSFLQAINLLDKLSIYNNLSIQAIFILVDYRFKSGINILDLVYHLRYCLKGSHLGMYRID